jgi:transglutaminase-like putative cysteine protease
MESWKMDGAALDEDPAAYLNPGRFVDSDSPTVIDFAERTAGDAKTDAEKTRRLFYAVRDKILYDPYTPLGSPDSYRASSCIEAGRGFCIPKAALLTASARALGISARVGYSDVRNHLATPRLLELLGTDVFTWHGFSEIYLEGRWVKVTPTFNKSLCEKFGVKTLEFDGRNDSLLHPFDNENRRHMEYVKNRGVYADVPFEAITTTFQEKHPEIYAKGQGAGGDFQNEAGAS